MLMTTSRLIILRAFNLTLGRIPFCSRMLKKILVRIMISNKKDKYVASSKYFTPDQLDED